MSPSASPVGGSALIHLLRSHDSQPGAWETKSKTSGTEKRERWARTTSMTQSYHEWQQNTPVMFENFRHNGHSIHKYRYPTRQVAIGTMAVYDVTRVTIPENQVGSMAYDVENYSLAMTYLTLLDGISW
ncbi:hypothetical protein B0H65DRAFT_576874 [Neurospora tetraspora]|uniref:Uncharacterized protein n=1 Tax=Neurospora tetraspora TaxID=94610 RepID=A0AAE0JDD0_9PEZI|nr:hypothetical protein B0H65DRAFT_576874 [Neurospora tetraspora]